MRPGALTLNFRPYDADTRAPDLYSLVMDTLELLGSSLRTGHVVNVNIVDLLNTLSGSCDVGGGPAWIASMFMYKVLETETGYLIESLLEHGQTVPLNVLECWSGAGGFEMGNGHHRLCAMLLCGFETVNVVVTEYLDFFHSEDESLDKEYTEEARGIFNSMVCDLRDVYYAALFAKETI